MGGGVKVDVGRMALAVVLSFILWGSGGLLLRRGRVDILAVVLHLYLYLLFWFIGLTDIWLLWFPVVALGGAYFSLDLARGFKAPLEGGAPASSGSG